MQPHEVACTRFLSCEIPISGWLFSELSLGAQCDWSLSAGQGLDQSGPDGEKIIGVHLLCTEGPQNHQV